MASLVVVCSVVSGQPTRLQSVTKAPGQEVTLEISGKSDKSRTPIMLKWTMIFPAQLLDFESAEAGNAGTASGKSLVCSMQKPYSYACSLAGGQNPIADGLIVIYRFTVKATAQPATTTLRIENAEATTRDSQKWRLEDVAATLVIR